MIGFLRGKLVLNTPPYLLLDINGVGYEVEAPLSTVVKLTELGQEVTLQTHLVVREDAHLLFGFLTETERTLFRTLIKVNGVGAKLALTILSNMNAADFHQCIFENDIPALVKIPGIGKKTAERLIIEIRDRLPGLANSVREKNSASNVNSKTPIDFRQEAINALITLGYKAHEAQNMVHAISEEHDNCEAYIRTALKSVR